MKFCKRKPKYVKLSDKAKICSNFVVMEKKTKMDKASEQKAPALLFEASWEVCNKVGGIYTVLSSKAKTLQQVFKDDIIFIGPDVWSEEQPSPYFIENRSSLRDWLARTKLPYGISVRVGRWAIPGKPIAVLVDFEGAYRIKDEVYSKMWELYQVDSLRGYGDYDEGCCFAIATAIVIDSISRFYSDRYESMVAHFDEWTSGMGLLYLKELNPAVATVFTTHATSIGRSICGNGKQLYDYMKGYNGDQMARELNIDSKHSLEKAVAHNADCFTTVSEITATECGQLLEKYPDIITPNGFERRLVPIKARYAQKREEARARILEVVSNLLGYKLGDDVFILATSGRCEYRNKGIDVFLDSIARLRSLTTNSKILALVLVPAWVSEPRQELKNAMTSSIYEHLSNRHLTHWLHNYDSDPINQRILQLGFHNDILSNVNVVYVPCYLNGNDGIFNMTYYDLLVGMDATVFPSYYEPWGYTPLESIAFSVPTITTSLSGFGRWIESSGIAGFENSGVEVVERTDSNYFRVVEAIAKKLVYLINCPDKLLHRIRRVAFSTSNLASWQKFILYYYEAYKLAISRNNQRQIDKQ